MGQRIKYEEFLDARSLAIVEIDIENGASYIVEFKDKSIREIKDLDSLRLLLKERLTV